MNRLTSGILAGLIATGPMTIVMRGLHRQLPLHERYPLPPELVTSRTAHMVGLSAPRLARGWQWKTYFSHFAYGATVGAIYAAMLPHSRSRNTASRGVVFGIAVWTLSYLGWIPAVGLMPTATKEPARRNAIMLFAHVVWGSLTALFIRGLQARSRREVPDII